MNLEPTHRTLLGDEEPAEGSLPKFGIRLAGRLVRRLYSQHGRIPVRVRLWDGSIVTGNSSAAIATISIRKPTTLLRLLVDGEFQFAECYTKGDIEVEGDLVGLLTSFNQVGPYRGSIRAKIVDRLRRCDLSAPAVLARRNARHHYDVGNDFYRRWLDPTMTYTCAYFERPEMTLAEAQTAKLDLVCRKLALRPGERVVEAGAGWGSLALHMAEHYGVSVRAYNVSAEQTAYARAQATRRGLDGRVEFVEADFRTITGRYDAFVSLGMLEHVGRHHYRELGRAASTVLEPHGRGLIHSIGRYKPLPTSRWIQRRVFPGGYAPSLGEMLEVFEPNEFVVWDVENLRPHYADTLKHWLAAFEEAACEIEQIHGRQFIRMWRFYLASSAASFCAGWHELYQIMFTRPGSQALPRTRTYSGSA